MSEAAVTPTADQQLDFLAKLQRLFTEGDFTATYKYALLIALADLSIEAKTHDAEPLYLSTQQIAHRFILMYWNHARAYGIGRSETQSGVLVQNIGKQAAVITRIQAFQAQHPEVTLARAGHLPALRGLVAEIADTVASQPMKYLQNFGGNPEPFLYTREHRGLRLLTGVAHCLRRFHPLIQQLARSGWLSHIKSNSRNQSILGSSDDLEEFLFHASRQSLKVIGIALRQLDGAKCFYCGGGLVGADVDHYIPFALYQRDLAHNFVLAHPGCNRSKSSALAGRVHLERWLDRLEHKALQLQEIGAKAGVVSDLASTRSMAHWAYQSALGAGAQAWMEKKRFEPIDQSYMRLGWTSA